MIYLLLTMGISLGLMVGLASVYARAEKTAVSPPVRPSAAPNNTTATNFPVNAAETYKIELNQDGIYEVSRNELQAAGMNVSDVNPATIEMMWRGQPVAYQLVNDNGDAVFDANEKIRFYGWAFDGPRTEKQFIKNNVFWLWADPANSPTTIQTKTNQTGGAVITATMTAVTREPENIFTTSYTNQWHTFADGNEPDSWYWDLVEQNALGATPTRTYQISLPYPVANGSNATYTIELLSREQSVYNTGIVYTVTGYINDYPGYGKAVWTEERSVNITNIVSSTELLAQANDVHLVFASNSNLAEIFLNRITVEYQRKLIAENNQLIFADEAGGSRQFHVSGFTESAAANVLVWDITVLTSTVQIEMDAANISGDTYIIGSAHDPNAKFIATTTANILDAAGIDKYAPTSLEPPGGSADWIAISHADFKTQADRLSIHRTQEPFGGLTTWVVDYEDVINQYGYGLPLPAAIRDYLAYALANWSPEPGYAVLFGSATLNPRNLACNHSKCPGGTAWDQNQPTFVVTDLVYEDRFQGLIPSDHTMTLLDGPDLLPDIAIGRITADTEADAEAAVSKIILYEQNQLDGVDWRDNLLFVADNADLGGNFYQENLNTAENYVPGNYATTQRYLVTGSQEETDALRDAMLDDVNHLGVAVLNYRGHGSVNRWAKPSIISSDSDDLNYWKNATKPTVILSADCLDGNFAFPGLVALSKALLTLRDSPGTTPIGAAAFWASTGLGFTYEHSVLHQNFYSGLFKHDLATIGDAVNHAKKIYHQGGYDNSEMYSFLLQGDPAMRMFILREQIYLPAILK
ncbi:MAG: hypothetical protein GY803_19880 [Chloroflexi bacterium]|nr:hypothetical protein [Chloroflexota bacterium]